MAVSTIRVAAARVSPGGWTRRCGRDRGARPTRRPLPAPRASQSSPPASGDSPADAASPEVAFAPDPALAASIDAVTRACDLLLDLGSSCRAHAKPDDTPVTVADLACQALVTQALRQSLGDDVVVIGEEDDAVCIADAATSEAVVEAVARHGGDGATAVEALARRVCVDDESLDALDMRRDAAESTRRRRGKSSVGSAPARGTSSSTPSTARRRSSAASTTRRRRSAPSASRAWTPHPARPTSASSGSRFGGDRRCENPKAWASSWRRPKAGGAGTSPCSAASRTLRRGGDARGRRTSPT